METQYHKKELMQVVKNITLFSIFLLFNYAMNSQNIVGSYYLIDQTVVAGDLGSTLIFEMDGTFKRVAFEHLGEKSIAGGYYRVEGDTLFLEYKPQGINFQSEIKLIDKKDLNDPGILFAEIKVFNSNGDPQPGVNLLIQNKEKKLVTGFSSNKEGNFPPLSMYDNYIQYFIISWIGHREVTIPAESLFGYSTNIEVHLKDSTVTYDNSDKIIKLIIIKRNVEGLELQQMNEDNGTVLKLKRIKPN